MSSTAVVTAAVFLDFLLEPPSPFFFAGGIFVVFL
jgi:hypothetical protein